MNRVLVLIICTIGFNGGVGGQWHSDGSSGGDYSAIPGEADVNYPILSEIPRTSFKCEQQQFPGYYADVEARCQVFHICANNLTYDFLCPNGTIFHQEYLVCVWWNQFDCNSAPNFFYVNQKVFEASMTESDIISKGNAAGGQMMGATGQSSFVGNDVPSQGNAQGSSGYYGGSDVLSQGNAQGSAGLNGGLSQGNQAGSGGHHGNSDGSYPGGDYSAIPGQPGADYPILSEIPTTSFKCEEQQFPGYYADVETKCQVFHVCWDNRKFDFLCPNGTIFHQEYFVCVWWNQFDCSTAPNFFALNENIYKSPMKGSNGYEMGMAVLSDMPSTPIMGGGVLSQENQAGSAAVTMGLMGSDVTSQSNQASSAMTTASMESGASTQGNEAGSTIMTMGSAGYGNQMTTMNMGGDFLSQSNQAGSSAMTTTSMESGTSTQGNEAGSTSMTMSMGSTDAANQPSAMTTMSMGSADGSQSSSMTTSSMGSTSYGSQSSAMTTSSMGSTGSDSQSSGMTTSSMGSTSYGSQSSSMTTTSMGSTGTQTSAMTTMPMGSTDAGNQLSAMTTMSMGGDVLSQSNQAMTTGSMQSATAQGGSSAMAGAAMSLGGDSGSTSMAMGSAGAAMSMGGDSGSTNMAMGSSHDDGSYSEGDYSAIPGEPGVDYPILSEIPKTSFKCQDQQYPGYYADMETKCQVFHVCSNNRQFDFLCPNGTIFHQEYLVCVWWNQFDCSMAPNFFAVNKNIYSSPMTGSGVLSQGNAAGSMMQTQGLAGGYLPPMGIPAVTGSNVLSQGMNFGMMGQSPALMAPDRAYLPPSGTRS